MIEAHQTTPTILRRVWGLAQWVISIFALILAAFTPSSNEGLSVPGAPVTGLFISLGVFAALAVSLSPPVFFRLPKLAKIGSYAGLLISFIVLVSFNAMVLDAYKRTPEGAKWAAEQAAEEKFQAAQDAAERAQETQAERKAAQDQAALDGAKQAVDDLRLLTEKLEACKSWGGEISELSEMVEASMHNPDSFEHESTEFVVPTGEGQNVLMEFRGTNGFGAVVKSQVLAHVDPDTCKVSDVSQPE